MLPLCLCTFVHAAIMGIRTCIEYVEGRRVLSFWSDLLGTLEEGRVGYESAIPGLLIEMQKDQLAQPYT